MTGPSRPQMAKLHAVLGDLGVTDRAEKLRVVSACIYRRVESTRDLTNAEARVVINTLGSVAQVRDDRAAALTRLVDIAERRMAVTS